MVERKEKTIALDHLDQINIISLHFVIIIEVYMNSRVTILKTVILKYYLQNSLIFDFIFANPIWCKYRRKL